MPWTLVRQLVPPPASSGQLHAGHDTATSAGAERREREERARADKAEASLARLTAEKQQAETRADRAEAALPVAIEARDEQRQRAADWRNAYGEVIDAAYEHAGLERPDLATQEGKEGAHTFVLAGAGRLEELEAWQREAHNVRNTKRSQRAVLESVKLRVADLATAAGQSAAFALMRQVAEAGLDAWLQAEAARKKREEKERRDREQRGRLTPGSPSYEAPEAVPDPGGEVAAWQLTREQFEAQGQPDEAGTRVTFRELDPPASLVYDPGNTIKWVEKGRGGAGACRGGAVRPRSRPRGLRRRAGEHGPSGTGDPAWPGGTPAGAGVAHHRHHPARHAARAHARRPGDRLARKSHERLPPNPDSAL